MGEITGALVAIVPAPSAAFLPMAFMSGPTGVVHRRFSATIISAMALSPLVAPVLTPAICAQLLRSGAHGGGRFGRGFDRGLDRLTDGYGGLRRRLSRTPLRGSRLWRRR